MDGAKQRSTEGGAGRGQRTFIVDRQFRAVGGQARQQRRRHRTRQVAPENRSTQKEDFGLIGVDQIRHHLRIRFVPVVFENRIGADINQIRVMFPHLDSGLLQGGTVATQENAGQLNAELVRKLAPFAQEFERNRMDFSMLILDENPDVLVAFEPLRQFLLHSCAAWRGGSWCGAHGPLPFSNRRRCAAVRLPKPAASHKSVR